MVATLPPKVYATMMDEWRSENLDRLRAGVEPRTWAEYLVAMEPVSGKPVSRSSS